MAMGKPVILLNLDDLYESLYDALNQYFSTWGDRKFVDIGLGTHRVKAFVNDEFRLVFTSYILVGSYVITGCEWLVHIGGQESSVVECLPKD